MSGKRLVEYFLVAGVDKKKASSSSTDGGMPSVSSSPLSPLSLLSEHAGSARVDEPNFIPKPPPDIKVPATILQRFPDTDRLESALPGAVEIFCQPLGWYLTYSIQPPSFVDFILTAEDGSRLYCSALNFYQLCADQVQESSKRKQSFTKTKTKSIDSVSSFSKCRELKRNMTSSDMQVDYLDEGCEESWTFKDVFGDLYEPISLCVISRLPFFELLQQCLKGLYLSWVGTGSNQMSNLEKLVAELLGDTDIPRVSCLPVRKPFGALKELFLPAIHEDFTLPYTSTSALWLLRRVGVHQLLILMTAIVSDSSVIFISSSLTVLTSALRALCSIVHPLKVTHAIVPVVPTDLLEYTQLPSTFIMGIHSSLRDQIDDEMLEVVEVYLDSGYISIPDGINLPHLPLDVKTHVQEALARVLDPCYEGRDLAFQKSVSPCGREVKSDDILDKEVRAIFLCLMAILLGDYQNFVTVLRFNPSPAFHFNLEAFLASKKNGNDHQSLLHKMAESIAFFNFCHERSVPYRDCDFFDELVARFASNPRDLELGKLFSQENIEELAEEIIYLLPSCFPPGGHQFNLDGVSPEVINNPLKSFPNLNGETVKKLMEKYEKSKKERNNKEKTEKEMVTRRTIPLLDCTPTHHRKTSAYTRGLDSLSSCLDAMFQSKIIEARKYIPSVIQALKSGILSDVLVPALVDRFLQYGTLLNSEQFDLIVKLLNSALVDQHSALMLLPLTTIIYREMNPGVVQYASTCVQNHLIWEKLEFWRDAIYLAIQAELVRIYAEVEAQHCKEMNKEEKKDDASPILTEPGDITLRSRQRIRSSSPARLRETLRATKAILSRSTRMRMRASVVVPGVSEGVLPPNAEPVTAQEALHHLAKILGIWDTLTAEKQTNLMKMEENATNNQLFLFVQRIISLRTPVELPEDEEEQRQFLKDLEQFIGQLLRLVEVDLSIELDKQGKIHDMIPDMIDIHLDSMAGLRKELKRLPISKPKVIKPPLIPGEVLLYEHGVHAYLLQDGRENRLMLPADGQVFLTSYRVIFLGTPCDPQAPSLIVTRSLPIASIYRLKKLNPSPLPPPVAINTVGGLQMRSVTAELLKIGFDDDTSQMDIKNLEQHIVGLRNPSTITLGIKITTPGPETQGVLEREGCAHPLSSIGGRPLRHKKSERNKGGNVLSHTDTLTRTRVISEVSQSPCCLEYVRLQLGSVNFQDSTKGKWRTTTVNLAYAVCQSYPAVLVVPTKVTDNSLASLAGQFQHNRFPVVTWKHPKKAAILLRSSSFVPSTIAKKKFTVGASKLLPSSVTQKPSLSSDKVIQNVAGVGVYNANVENYLYDVMLISPTDKPSLDLVQHISMPPPMVEFEEELKRQGSFRGYLPPTSPSPSNDSNEVDSDMKPPENTRMRAATYTYKIRNRVGSSVSQISRFVQDNSKLLPSPPAKRKLSVRRRKMFSSPQLGKRHTMIDNTTKRLSSSSTASDISIEKTKQKDILKEGPEEEETSKPLIKKSPRSAEVSPTATIKLTHKRTRSSDQIIELKASDIDLKDIVMSEKTGSPVSPYSPIDWEALGSEDKDGQFNIASRPSTSTPEEDERNSSPDLPGETQESVKLKWDHFSENKDMVNFAVDQSPGTFSTLPTNPRDWMVMDALPSELRYWQANALYILGDKNVLQDIPEDLYPNCMFVPVEAPSPSDVSVSFKKLMRACIPSSPQNTFLSAVQESGWITQLTHLMQLGGAVADLIDIQGSSVLVCLENGWDATAQVVSIAEILLDPYYRTFNGFKMLIEKDWLSFGHRFSHNGSHTAANPITTYSPIFLQFLDIVHQILKQFPLSFEFNDFYLKMLAYHHSSMRFHTFAADSEKERYANNWLPYRPRLVNLHGSLEHKEEFVSFWDHIDALHKDSMIFYNFKYQPSGNRTETQPLRPYSYQANMDVWNFYLDNNLSQFPFYDTELISEGPLTLLDMHHNFFEKDKSLSLMGIHTDQPGSMPSEISSLLWQYTGLRNALAETLNYPQDTWMELLDRLLISSLDYEFPIPLFPMDDKIITHGQTLHKRTTMAVLIKGKLAVELEAHFTTPHQFEPLERGRAQHECAFCKHQINRTSEGGLHKCKKCGCVCHAHCMLQMPYNCGQEKQLRRRFSKRLKSQEGPEKSNWSRYASSVFFHNKNMPDRAEVSEGYLYKRGKIVKNWKQRWFVLDTEKGELSYYNSNSDNKCHGTIFLRDILSVEEAEPQVVPILKPGEGSFFFFNVVTQKRVYHLMALRAAERTEWMARIKSII